MKLNVNNLNVNINKAHILKNFSLDVEDGEFVALLGPSGCGKSTFLKTIVGINTPSAGQILLGKRDLVSIAPNKRNAVIVFQDLRLFPHMTVAENIAFPLKMQGVSKEERMKTADILLEKIQLPGFGKRRIHQLSGGQQQRVAIARALASRPDLLLLDEPFSSLDENLRDDIRKLVLSLQKEFRITTILVTHDYQEAFSMASRVAVMSEGSVIQYGTPDEICNAPADSRVSAYLGSKKYFSCRIEDSTIKKDNLVLPDGEYEIIIKPKDRF